MSLDPKVSVIIPFYNAQNTIEQTVNSITSQSYKNIEIILVNDGSTDNSYKICQKLKKEDDRIQIINKENGGVASARNIGISCAIGKYIIHADSDDIVLPNAYFYLVKKAESDKADIVVGSYFSGTKDNYIEKIPDTEIMNPKIFAQKILENKTHAGLWNKLVLKKLYENFNFMDGVDYKEDLFFFVTKLMECKYKISIIKEPVYFYFNRGDSITNKSYDKNVINNFIIIKELENLNCRELDYSIRVQKAYANIEFILNKKDSKYNYKEFYPNIRFLDLNINVTYKALLFFEKYYLGFFNNIYLKIKEWRLQR